MHPHWLLARALRASMISAAWSSVSSDKFTCAARNPLGAPSDKSRPPPRPPCTCKSCTGCARGGSMATAGRGISWLVGWCLAAAEAGAGGEGWLKSVAALKMVDVLAAGAGCSQPPKAELCSGLLRGLCG